MNKSRKRTRRGDYYRTLADGYKIMKAPVAASFHAAAEHYDQSDTPTNAAPDSALPDSQKDKTGT